MPNQTPQIKPLLIQSRTTRNTRKSHKSKCGLDVERQDGKAAKSLEMTSDDTVTAEQLQVARVLTSMCETMLQA